MTSITPELDAKIRRGEPVRDPDPWSVWVKQAAAKKAKEEEDAKVRDLAP